MLSIDHKKHLSRSLFDDKSRITKEQFARIRFENQGKFIFLLNINSFSKQAKLNKNLKP